MALNAQQVRVRRERQMAAELMDDYGVKKALQKLRELRGGRGYGYRRGLLSRALRLTRSMSPEIADLLHECKLAAGYERPVELFVTPEPVFNASCFRESEKGPTIMTISARLLEVFSPAELRFVVGHELGHAVFDHYSIPMPITASIQEMGVPFVTRPVALRLYAWCRAAELSADRVGLICARDPEAAASGFFKLASGVTTNRLVPDLSAFAEQVESLATAPEAREKPRDDDDTLDCFSTHPYNPVRVRAVWAFARSEPYLSALQSPQQYPTEGALTLEQVEQVIERDLALMEPTYLQEKGDDADVLRRLLYTAGMAVADAADGVEKSELHALGLLLGADRAEHPGDVKRVLEDLPGRIADARALPLASRAQLVQHLTIIAAADGQVQDEELDVMEDICRQLDVPTRIIHHTIRGATHPMD